MNLKIIVLKFHVPMVIKVKYQYNNEIEFESFDHIPLDLL